MKKYTEKISLHNERTKRINQEIHTLSENQHVNYEDSNIILLENRINKL